MTNLKLKKILDSLDKEYGKDNICFLKYKKDYELLFATILAAQCKDDRVNEVTKILFSRYKKIENYKNAKTSDIEKIIKPCGLSKTKAKSIKESAALLIEKYNNKVPKEMKDLTSLKGVGRKTANVIRTHIWNEPSIVVDTHVTRISQILGFTKNNDPKKIEKDLEKLLPKEHWSRINPQLMTLGRTYCKARKRDCDNCFLNTLCEKNIISK